MGQAAHMGQAERCERCLCAHCVCSSPCGLCLGTYQHFRFLLRPAGPSRIRSLLALLRAINVPLTHVHARTPLHPSPFLLNAHTHTCRLAPLLVAKYEVDPMVQVSADMGRLQRGPVLGKEVLGRGSPGGQLNIHHSSARLAAAQRQAREVE